jgi:hypothetical protein
VLARHYAWERRERYCGLWWVRAEQLQTLTDDLAELGARLGLPLSGMEPEDAAQATLDQIARHKTGKPWLLIYDNVEDKTLARRFTPPENAHILYTTRLANWFAEADDLPVGVFPRETAIDFLLAFAPGQDREAAGRLADALGCLPLALDHARALIRARGWSFDRYREQLAGLLGTMPKDSASDYPNTVHATYSLAMDRAREECAAAQTLMGLIAHYAPEQIPLWLIPENAMPEMERDEAIEALQRVSLIAHDPLADGSPAISVHRLVQEVVRAWLREAGSAEAHSTQATQIVASAYDANRTHAAARHNTAWLPHGLAILDHGPLDGPAAWHTLWTCNQIGDFGITRGELYRAKDAYETGLKIARGLADASPENHQWQRDLSVSHDRIGNVQSAQGNLADALNSYKASLGIRERLAKADPGNAGWQRDLSVSHDKIGDVQTAQGNHNEALSVFRQGLTIRERLAQTDPGNATWQRDLAISHGRVAMIEAQKRNGAEALTTFRKGREIITRLKLASPTDATLPNDLAWFDAQIAALEKREGNDPSSTAASD